MYHKQNIFCFLSSLYILNWKESRLGSSCVNFLVACCPSRWSNFERRWRISLTLLCSLLFRSWIIRLSLLYNTKIPVESWVRWAGENIYQATPFGSCLLWGWVDYNSNLFCVGVLCEGRRRRRQIESSPSKRKLQHCLLSCMLFSLRVVSCTFAWRFGAKKTISDASCKKNLLRDKRMQEQK